MPNNKSKRRRKLGRIRAKIFALVEKFQRHPQSWQNTILANGDAVESAMRLINDPEHYARAKCSLDPRLIIDLLMDVRSLISDIVCFKPDS